MKTLKTDLNNWKYDLKMPVKMLWNDEIMTIS